MHIGFERQSNFLFLVYITYSVNILRTLFKFRSCFGSLRSDNITFSGLVNKNCQYRVHINNCQKKYDNIWGNFSECLLQQQNSFYTNVQGLDF